MLVVSGLILLWGGAMAFGALLMLRDRWRKAAAAGHDLPGTPVRQGIEALCLFLGTAGLVFGLGLLALGAWH